MFLTPFGVSGSFGHVWRVYETCRSILFPSVMKSQQKKENSARMVIQYSATPPEPPDLAGSKKG